MKQIYFSHIFIILFNILAIGHLQAQVCDPNVLTGPNQVINAGFEDGDTGFYTDIPCSWNNASTCSCHGDWSEPGEYYIGSKPNEATPCGPNFQNGWSNSPHSGNKFMMVDGKGGATDPIVWQQTVTVESNKYYYFETWISGLGNNDAKYRAKLKFVINDSVFAMDIVAPAGGEGWIKYSQPWLSEVDGPIVIKIIDNQPDNIEDERDDFALDDIRFQIGCPDAAMGRQPDLGENLTFCGKSVPTLTLDPGLSNLQFGEEIYWSTGQHSSYPDQSNTTIDVSAGGTYYVCMEQTGSCAKIDTIIVSDRFWVNLGSDVELCDPAALTLDAKYTGPGVTYQWYKDGVPLPLGTGQELFVNEEGLYKVIVDDPICQTEQDSIDVKLRSGSPEPINIDFCLTSAEDTSITFSVNPAGTSYEWYDSPTSTTILPGGSGTSSYTKDGIVTGDTLYVQDVAISNVGSVVPIPASYGTGGGETAKVYRGFDALTDIVLESVTMRVGPSWGSNPCNGIVNSTSSAFTISLYQNGLPMVPAIEKTGITVNCGDYGSGPAAISIPLDFTIPEGTGYELRAPFGNGAFYYGAGGLSKEASSIPNIISVPASTESGAFFNWQIKAKSPCNRIPVMARDICVLPVDFAGIRAIKTDNGVKIFWATASEKDNSHFEIERLINGDWITIGQVQGNGNSKDYIQYEFTDHSAPNQIVYYRIKQVDTDGKYSYSSVVSVDNISFFTQLRPNPSNGSTNLTIYSAEKINSKVTIHDAVGRLVEELSLSTNQEHMIGESFSSGLYIISIWAGPEPERIRFIKK